MSPVSMAKVMEKVLAFKSDGNKIQAMNQTYVNQQAVAPLESGFQWRSFLGFYFGDHV